MLFSRDTVEEALEDLVDELVSGNVSVTVQVVGGAAVALQGSREVLTQDIDALHAPSPEFTDAVVCVSEKRGWPTTWLNDAALMFASHHDTPDDWDTLIDREGVVIQVAGIRLLLAMKLLAGRGRRDAQDIDRLADACGVSSVEEALEIFETFYPNDVIAKMALRQLEERFGKGS
jgi:hypothetical protein